MVFYVEATSAVGKIVQHESRMVFDGAYKVVSRVNRCVFTGDTLFIGGCGKFFEGDADDMLKSMDKISALPDDTKIFCGHEYTKPNMNFCLESELRNPYAFSFKKKYVAMLDSGEFTVPSVLQEEKLYNVFLRCRTDNL